MARGQETAGPVVTAIKRLWELDWEKKDIAPDLAEIISQTQKEEWDELIPGISDSLVGQTAPGQSTIYDMLKGATRPGAAMDSAPGEPWEHDLEDAESARVALDILPVVLRWSQGRRDSVTKDEVSWCVHLKRIDPTLNPLGLYLLAREYMWRTLRKSSTSDLDTMLGLAASPGLNDEKEAASLETVSQLESYRNQYGRLIPLLYMSFGERHRTLDWALIQLVDSGHPIPKIRPASGWSRKEINDAAAKLQLPMGWHTEGLLDLGILYALKEQGQGFSLKLETALAGEAKQSREHARAVGQVYVAGQGKNKEEDRS